MVGFKDVCGVVVVECVCVLELESVVMRVLMAEITACEFLFEAFCNRESELETVKPESESCLYPN